MQNEINNKIKISNNFSSLYENIDKRRNGPCVRLPRFAIRSTRPHTIEILIYEGILTSSSFFFLKDFQLTKKVHCEGRRGQKIKIALPRHQKLLQINTSKACTIFVVSFYCNFATLDSQYFCHMSCEDKRKYQCRKNS